MVASQIFLIMFECDKNIVIIDNGSLLCSASFIIKDDWLVQSM